MQVGTNGSIIELTCEALSPELSGEATSVSWMIKDLICLLCSLHEKYFTEFKRSQRLYFENGFNNISVFVGLKISTFTTSFVLVI